MVFKELVEMEDIGVEEALVIVEEMVVTMVVVQVEAWVVVAMEDIMQEVEVDLVPDKKEDVLEKMIGIVALM